VHRLCDDAAGVISYLARRPGPPQSLWPWVAEPGRWRRWAPHLLATRGLETMVRLIYGPLIRLFLANLVRVAGD
jgi:hypothetical protein